MKKALEMSFDSLESVDVLLTDLQREGTLRTIYQHILNNMNLKSAPMERANCYQIYDTLGVMATYDSALEQLNISALFLKVVKELQNVCMSERDKLVRIREQLCDHGNFDMIGQFKYEPFSLIYVYKHFMSQDISAPIDIKGNPTSILKEIFIVYSFMMKNYSDAYMHATVNQAFIKVIFVTTMVLEKHMNDYKVLFKFKTDDPEQIKRIEKIRPRRRPM